METAKINLQRGNILLSAEGSESFVRDAIAMWDTVLVKGQPVYEPDQPTDIKPEGREGDTKKREAPSGLSQYDHVFDSVDDTLKIIAHIPGKNKAEKTRQVALLTLFGNHLLGNEHVPSDVIRTACIDQGCYDNTNFAGYLRGLKQQIVMNTKAGGQYDVKLTAPGRKSSRELADQLQAGEQ